MGYVYAFVSTFVERVKANLHWGEILVSLVTHVPLAFVLAWIAGESSSSVPIDYLFVGVLLMSIWNRVAIRLGWSITWDILNGTYDYIAAARTPLAMVIFARALALVVPGILSALLPLFVIGWIAGEVIQVTEPLLLLFGIGIGAFSVLSVAIVFAPLFLLVRGREGFFNVIRPLGVVLGGFLYPVMFLAPGIEFVARIFPAAWAMDSIIVSMEADSNVIKGTLNLVIAFLISMSYLILAYLLLIKVEHRVRIEGNTRVF